MNKEKFYEKSAYNVEVLDFKTLNQKIESKSDSDHNHNEYANKNIASDTSNGLLSSTDKVKLDSISENANNYIHPESHDANMILFSDGKNFQEKLDDGSLNGKDGTEVPNATTSVAGKVILSNDINNNSESLAATSKSIKTVNDRVSKVIDNENLESKDFLKSAPEGIFSDNCGYDLNNYKDNLLTWTYANAKLKNLPYDESGACGYLEVIGSKKTLTKSGHTIQKYYRTDNNKAYIRCFNVDNNTWTPWRSL